MLELKALAFSFAHGAYFAIDVSVIILIACFRSSP
jgi:hypothetical protein